MRSVFALMCISVLLFSAGCGKSMETKGDVTIQGSIPSIAVNPAVAEFNRQLGEIKDETTAEKAVSSFVNYVDSRLVKPSSGASIQSLGTLVAPEYMKKMAQAEAAARGGSGFSINSEDPGSQQPLLDVGVITDNVNVLGSNEGIRVDDETVMTAKTVVEGSIPNINPDNNSGITPLEASVIGYALISGDDGTASEESVDLPSEKMNAFVENVTQ